MESLYARAVQRECDRSSNAAHEPLDRLLVAVGTGDRCAFRELYNLSAPRLFSAVRRVLIDPSQAEEVTQEVYLEIWQKAPTFDAAKGAALSWMLSMARRRAVDRVRASQASRDRDHRVGLRDREHDHDVVAEQVEAVVESDRVRRSVGRLSELQRRAIELIYLDGYSYQEASAVLEAPIGTVKTRVRDGLIRLRGLFAAAA